MVKRFSIISFCVLVWVSLSGCAEIARAGGNQPGKAQAPTPELFTFLSATPFAPSPAAAQPSTPTPTHPPSPAIEGLAGTPKTPPAEMTPTALACWQAGGRYESGSLRSAELPLPLEFRVYLPPCYAEEPQRRYPVLYLIHGQNYNDDQWDRLGVDERADTLVARGEIPPFLVVMPRDRNWGQPSEDAFGQVVAEELVPWVDSRYRTLPDREHRAIGGLSRGAGWAVHLGLSRWDLFGSLGAHSLAVFWGDTPHIRSWLGEIPNGRIPRIFMDIGDRDRSEIMKSAVWFENLLTEKRIPHDWYLFPGYHEEAYWQAHVDQYLRWYSAGW